MKRPVCFGAIGVLACLLIAAYLPQAAFWLPAAVLFGTGLLLWLRRRRQWAICCMAAACLGFLLWLPACFAVTGMQYQGQRVTVEGQVYRVSGRSAAGYSAVVRADRASGGPGGFFLLCEGLPDAVPGQQLSVSVQVEGLADTPGFRQWYADHVYIKGTSPRNFVVTGLEKGLRYRLYCYQKRLSQVLLVSLNDAVGGTLAAMTTGDRTALAPGIYRDYQAAGLPHVLVVSGLHLMIFCGLGNISKSTAAARALHGVRGMVLALFYMGLTGLQPSVLRAGFMAIFQCVGLICGVPVDPLTSLAVSGVLVSLGAPYAVCDVALQLSLFACLGVLWAGDRFGRGCPAPLGTSRVRKAWYVLRQQLAVSCGAALFVLPVQLFHGMPLRPLGVLSNLACFLLVGPVIRWGLLAALAGSIPALYGAGQLLALGAGGLALLLNGITARFALPVCWQLNAFLGLGILAAAAVLLTLGTRFYRPVLAGTAACTCLLAGLVLGVSLYQRGSVTVTLLGSPDAPSAVVMQDGQALILYQGGRGTAQAIRAWLAGHPVKAIRQVVDLRPASEKECPFTGQKNYSLLLEEGSGLAPLHPLDDVQLVFTRFTAGSAATIVCGDAAIWLYSGTVPANLRPAAARYVAAGKASPGPLPAGAQVLTLTRAHPWLAEVPANRIQCAADGPLTVRLWPQSQAHAA